MKKTAMLPAFLLFSTMGFAQGNQHSREFGRVTQQEMVMKEYEDDPDAEAVMLYNLGEYRYTGNDTKGRFELRMTRKIKTKILKQAGIQYANFEIPIYNGDLGWESIENIEATTYNIDRGFTQTKLQSKNIFEEKVNDNVVVKKIALPDVRPGSVIELSYTIVTPYFFNMRRWYFQQRIPVIYSHLEYRAIDFYEYVFIIKGTDKLDIFTSDTPSHEIRFKNLTYREIAYHFGMNNTPAFRDEDFISSEDDYIININFQLSKIHHPNGGSRAIMTTWPEMCDEFLKDDDFGKYMRNVEKQASKIMTGIELKDKTTLERIEIMTDFVKSRYRWNGNTGKFANTGLKEFLQEKSGNVGNINLLLAGLLKSQGIEAHPVILSTRDNGMISLSHPFQQFFNYVIVLANIEDRVVLLDATDPYLYYSVLPVNCLNVYGLVIKPKSEDWITIQQKTTSMLQKNLSLKINPQSNSVQAEAMYLATGPDAHRLRSVYLGNSDNLIKYVKEKEQVNITAIQTQGIGALQRPFTFFFTMETPVENHSDKLFVNPFCSLTVRKNPFTQSTRLLPIDLVYLQGESYKSMITIPKGYKIEYIPGNQSIEDDMFSFSYAIEKIENQLSVDAQFHFKQTIISPENYQKLKEYFNQMVNALSDMVVFVQE